MQQGNFHIGKLNDDDKWFHFEVSRGKSSPNINYIFRNGDTRIYREQCNRDIVYASLQDLIGTETIHIVSDLRTVS